MGGSNLSRLFADEMVSNWWKRKPVRYLLIAPLALIAADWLAGTALSWPVRRAVGELPKDLRGEAVTFTSASGATLKGWLLHGEPGKGAVILMHGVRGNRLQVLERARFLNRQGYAALLFDFQAHGESTGARITFGHLESHDAQAAVQFVKARLPDEKLGVIGISLGGAAAALAQPPLPVEALVLEMVYPDIHRAIENRLARYLGGWARGLTPLLEWQLQPRLGIGPEALRPLECVDDLRVPKLFIVGERDRHTPLVESQELFNAACEPKMLWVVVGAQHEDLYAKVKEGYEQRVGAFFEKTLRSELAARELAASETTELQAELLAQFAAETKLEKKARLLDEIVLQPNSGAALLRLANSTTDVTTHYLAIRGLGTVKYEQAVPDLLGWLRHGHPWIRGNAARALGEIRATSAAAPLIWLLRREKDGGVIEQASLSLQWLKAKEAVPVLKQIALRHSGQTLSWVLQAIGTLGTERDIPFLAQFLYPRPGLVSDITGRAAGQAIEAITGKDFGFPKRDGPVNLVEGVDRARKWWEANRAKYLRRG
jgi:uncharacterized protein